MLKPVGNLILCIMAAFAMPGCTGPVGTWKMTEIVPADADRNFAVRTIAFTGDGNYKLEVVRDGTLQPMSGTYKFDPDEKLLVFTDASGGQTTYRAEVCGTCGYLYVWNAGEKQEWKAKFKRR